MQQSRRRRVDLLFGPFDPAQHHAVLSILDEGEHRRVIVGVDGDDFVELECPACANVGYIHRSITRLEDYETEVEHNRDGFPEPAYVTVTDEYSPVLFECPVCDLVLDRDEIELLPAAGTVRGQERETLSNDEMRDY